MAEPAPRPDTAARGHAATAESSPQAAPSHTWGTSGWVLPASMAARPVGRPPHAPSIHPLWLLRPEQDPTSQPGTAAQAALVHHGREALSESHVWQAGSHRPGSHWLPNTPGVQP